MIKLVFVLSFLLFSTFALSLNGINDDKNVNRSLIKVYPNDNTDGSRVKRDTIAFANSFHDKIIYVFSKNTFENIKKHCDFYRGDNYNYFDFLMTDIYKSYYNEKNEEIDYITTSSLSYVIQNKYDFIKDTVENSNSTWFKLSTEKTKNYEDIDNLLFKFEPVDSDEQS